MESRVVRSKNRKKDNLIKIFKLIVIIMMTLIFVLLVYKVNDTIIDLNVLDNTSIFEVDLEGASLTLLGKTYNLNR